jgi:hypothetical protein
MLIDLFKWWANLKGFELILWAIALFFSLLFLIQTVISLFTGGETDGDMDADGDGFGSSFFTVKNMIAFFTMFGWAGLAAYKGGLNNGLTILVGLAAGVSMVLVMFLLMRQSAKLKHSGTMEMKNALDKVGETYLRIPAKRKGIGKIQVQVQSRLMELDAMTDDEEDIATGRPIKVVSLLNNQILMVTTSLSN